MRIMKVINNNTVCVEDEKGKDLIVSGKGISGVNCIVTETGSNVSVAKQ